MVDTRANRPWVGFDLGGTKMLGGVFNADLRLLGKKRRKTKGTEGPKAGLERIIETIQDAMKEGQVEGQKLAGIGVGCPGQIDLDKGTVLEAARLVGVPLFDEHPEVRERYRAQKQAELALLPAAARPRRRIDDDF